MEVTVDEVVFKRLKFISKIIKAISAQPNIRNRQAHVYVLEVLDAVGDWSGGNEAEAKITDLLDNQIFPQVCRLVATLSKDEFNTFQKFFSKYLLGKWDEISNFLVLDFLSDIYGFIASIAPIFVIEEYVKVFLQDSMPPHITLVILPAIIRNLSDEAASKLSAKLSNINNIPDFSLHESLTNKQSQQVVDFWKSLSTSFEATANFAEFSQIMHQCILSLECMDMLSEADLMSIVNSMNEWKDDTITEAFLLTSMVLLASVCLSDRQPTKENANIKTLIHRVIADANNCGSHQICMGVMKMLQKILEYMPEEFQTIEICQTIEASYDIQNVEELHANSNRETSDDALEALETCVQRVLSDSDLQGESTRKRIKLMIDSLQKLC